MNLERLTTDQDENARHKRKCTGDKADAQSSERNDADNDEINREQKHADVFGNHGTSIGSCARGWQFLKTLTLLIFLRQALNRQSRRLWCKSQDLYLPATRTTTGVCWAAAWVALRATRSSPVNATSGAGAPHRTAPDRPSPAFARNAARRRRDGNRRAARTRRAL